MLVLYKLVNCFCLSFRRCWNWLLCFLFFWLLVLQDWLLTLPDRSLGLNRMLFIVIFLGFWWQTSIRWNLRCTVSRAIDLSIFSLIILKYGVSVTQFDFADVNDLTAMYGWIIVRLVIANMLRLKEHPVVVIALMMLLSSHIVIIDCANVVRHIGSIYWHHMTRSMQLIWHRHHAWLFIIYNESNW